MRQGESTHSFTFVDDDTKLYKQKMSKAKTGVSRTKSPMSKTKTNLSKTNIDKFTI